MLLEIIDFHPFYMGMWYTVKIIVLNIQIDDGISIEMLDDIRSVLDIVFSLIYENRSDIIFCQTIESD